MWFPLNFSIYFPFNVHYSQYSPFLISCLLDFLPSISSSLKIFFFLMSPLLNIFPSPYHFLSFSSFSNIFSSNIFPFQSSVSPPFNIFVSKCPSLSMVFLSMFSPYPCLPLSIFSPSNLNFLMIPPSQLFFLNILHSQFLPLSTFFPNSI